MLIGHKLPEVPKTGSKPRTTLRKTFYSENMGQQQHGWPEIFASSTAVE